MNYLIAYKDKHGKDCEGLPYLIDAGDNIIEATAKKNELLNNKNFKDVTLFWTYASGETEEFSWEYVDKHKIRPKK